QECPRKFYLSYLAPSDEEIEFEPSPALEIGSAVHFFLALHYGRMMKPKWMLGNEPKGNIELPEVKLVRDELLNLCEVPCIEEGWKAYERYADRFLGEEILPMTVEFYADIKDPVFYSCR